jgi:hypothetical protein
VQVSCVDPAHVPVIEQMTHAWQPQLVNAQLPLVLHCWVLQGWASVSQTVLNSVGSTVCWQVVLPPTFKH